MKEYKEQLYTTQNYIHQRIDSIVNNHKNHLLKNIDLMDAYSPLKVLKRGYSITYNKDKVIKSIDEVQKHDTIVIRVNDGFISTEVLERKKLDEKNRV